VSSASVTAGDHAARIGRGLAVNEGPVTLLLDSRRRF
jgi:hypothetical protein